MIEHKCWLQDNVQKWRTTKFATQTIIQDRILKPTHSETGYTATHWTSSWHLWGQLRAGPSQNLSTARVLVLFKDWPTKSSRSARIRLKPKTCSKPQQVLDSICYGVTWFHMQLPYGSANYDCLTTFSSHTYTCSISFWWSWLPFLEASQLDSRQTSERKFRTRASATFRSKCHRTQSVFVTRNSKTSARRHPCTTGATQWYLWASTGSELDASLRRVTRADGGLLLGPQFSYPDPLWYG